MNGDVGNHQKVFINIYKLGLYFRAVCCDYPSGNGKRSVKPSGAYHSAVSLGVYADVLAKRLHFGVRLYSKGRRVAVRGYYVEPADIPLANLEGNHRGEIACDIILSARRDVPFFALFKLLKAFV